MTAPAPTDLQSLLAPTWFDICYNAAMRLMREVRCFPFGKRPGEGQINSWSGSARGADMATFWNFRVYVDGSVDPATGFLCDIKALDGLVRDTVLPNMRDRLDKGPLSVASIGQALRAVFPAAAERCPSSATLAALELFVSAHLRVGVSSGDPQMIQVTRSYEFAAAHRLHRADWSDEQNHKVFGKCSNPQGHGHNYVLEVTVSGQMDERFGTIADAPHVDEVVQERVIQPFDHRNLNVECPEFADLNPTVENIAHVIWSRLEGAFDRGALTAVRVWETPKTFAEFTGP